MMVLFMAVNYRTKVGGLKITPPFTYNDNSVCLRFRSGLINKFGELIEEHGPHGNIDFASKINLDLYLDDKAVCKRGKLILK